MQKAHEVGPSRADGTDPEHSSIHEPIGLHIVVANSSVQANAIAGASSSYFHTNFNVICIRYLSACSFLNCVPCLYLTDYSKCSCIIE